MPGTISDDVDLYNKRMRYKFGADVLYTFKSWMAAGVRADRVAPNSKDSGETFYVLAPRLVFDAAGTAARRSRLLYAKWFYGPRSHSEFSAVIPSDLGARRSTDRPQRQPVVVRIMDDQIPTRAHRARPGGLLALVLALLLVLAGGALPARAQAARASARLGPGRGADPAQPGAGSVAEPRSVGAAGRRAAGRPHARLRPTVAERGRVALRLSRLPHGAAQRRHRQPPESDAGAEQDRAAFAAGRPRRPRDLLAHRRRADDLRADQLLRGQQRRHRPGQHRRQAGRRLDVVPRAGVAAGRHRRLRRHHAAHQQPAAPAGAGRRVHVALRHDRRVRRGALRHAADRPHQRRRRAGHRQDRLRRPDADPGRGGARAEQQGVVGHHRRRLEQLRRSRRRQLVRRPTCTPASAGASS